MSLEIIILAAGQGTRMRSALPKVLHDLAGRSLLEHVIGTAQALGEGEIRVVFGHGGEQVKAQLSEYAVTWIEQAEQLGTGHAVQQALPHLEPGRIALVLYGDVPLIKEETLKALLALCSDQSMALLTAELKNPTGYGRIVRDVQGAVQRIVEQKDAADSELAISEINTGVLAVQGAQLERWLGQLENDNAQGEYYLTDIIGMAVADDIEVQTVMVVDEDEILGVNDKRQLAHLERVYQLRQADQLMCAGATLRDPTRFDVRGELTTGQDVVIDINCLFEGRVTLGDNVSIGPNCVIRDCEIKAGTIIEANCVLEQTQIGAHCTIGPFARLRPGTELASQARVGNFVEIKKSLIGEGSKVNHLSYIGDSELGHRVNVGAGTITCNYDGANKHRTIIGDDAFIGSNTELVAPVNVGAGATIGAGSTVTKDVEAGALSITRAPQRSVANWKRPTKAVKKD